ncbi:MAG TPA: S8 family serine peptidase [Limnobacter sp.]|uniref:S8 family serine peptidase n=1 Tax=Limnobacter sp. TaxID=2003368 RepID=UPI002E2F4A33|nr:S8 family serine peptidase [Limnobacter sp.]HEX5485753.1 S8 family serine peptidase [Limnobacter sp.]
MRRLVFALCLFFSVVQSSFAAPVSTRWIIHIPAAGNVQQVLGAATQRLGVPVRVVRPLLQPDSWLVQLDRLPLLSTLATQPAVSALLNAIPGVGFASPDIEFKPVAIAPPDDPLYGSNQADYMGNGTYAGMNMPAVWEQTRGSASKIIAVLDTGVLFDHPELRGRLLRGYDFVSQVTPPTGTPETAPVAASGSNDGNGRDPDASDPGDAPPPGFVCSDGSTTSSFHGTAVASVAVAQANNSAFLAGMDWNAKVLPVRISGRCGTATTSDIVDGMYWATGSDRVDPAIGVNPNPANVINLSFATSAPLGSNCTDAGSAAVRLAIGDARARGVAVVIAAGNNNGGPVEFPASCPGVIAAGAVQSNGALASYSAQGTTTNALTLMAPGDAKGQFVAAYNPGILGGSHNGAPDPTKNGAAMFAGTSFAAPMLSAVVTLIESAAPNLSVDQIINVLKTSALPYPSGASCSSGNLFGLGGCSCSSNSCGAGIVNPLQALNQARALAGLPVANVPQSRVVSGDSTTLDAGISSTASGSNTGLTYQWTQVYGNPTTLVATVSPILQVTAGLTNNLAEYQLQVTDSNGNQVGASTVRVLSAGVDERNFTPSGQSAPVVTQPAQSSGSATTVSTADGASSGGSGGGGGGGGLAPLGLMGLFALLRFYRRGGRAL